MKFNYKKIASVLASAVMLSSTIGFAAAASYPAPFVQSGAANGAIVYGSVSAAAVDMAAATDIVKSDLDKKITVTGDVSTPTGGESYKLEKTSTKFDLGNGITDVVSATVTDDNLPTLLKDGVYTDDRNDEFKYTQKLTMSNLSYTMFDDSDYKADTPSMGMKAANGAKIMNYTLDFTDQPLWSHLETTEVTMMGKSYYILDATANTSLTLLDSAEKALIAEGETQTVNVNGKSYEVNVNFVSSTPKAKLEVNGEVTNSLAVGETQKLKDGSYVGIRDILYNSKDNGISKVEFSIGSGKLKLVNGSDIELNDESVSGVQTLLTSGSTGTLNQVMLIWSADEDSFAADGSAVEIPGFKSIKLSYGGLTASANEEIAVKNGGSRYLELNSFPLKDATVTIPLLYGNSTGVFNGVGQDSTHLLRTGAAAITFAGDTDDMFVLSWSDGKDAESYVMRATNFKTDNSVDKVSFQVMKGDAWSDVKTDANMSDTITVGNAEMTVGAISRSAKTVALTVSGNNNFNTLYSKEGMKIYLPFAANTSAAGAVNFTAGASGNMLTGHNGSSFYLVMSEEDKNGNKASGKNLTVTLSWTSDAKAQVGAVSGGSLTNDLEIGSDDEYTNVIYSALATSYVYDQAGDQDTLKVTYHGEEAYGNFFLTASTATIGGASKIMIVTDSEVESVKDMNLVVVGGSCVNSVAATLLGSNTALCGDDFTAVTKVGAGKYIIKTYTSPYNSAKVATLVAGYNADDTKNALNKLVTGVSTDVGAEEIGPALS